MSYLKRTKRKNDTEKHNVLEINLNYCCQATFTHIFLGTEQSKITLSANFSSVRNLQNLFMATNKQSMIVWNSQEIKKI